MVVVSEHLVSADELAELAGMSRRTLMRAMQRAGLESTAAYPREAALRLVAAREASRRGMTPAELSVARVNEQGVSPRRCPGCGGGGPFNDPGVNTAGDVTWTCAGCGEPAALKASTIAVMASGG